MTHMVSNNAKPIGVKKMAALIVKSRSGTYHKGFDHGGAVMCNARSGLKVNAARESDIARALDSSFCKKCFPNGKPIAA